MHHYRGMQRILKKILLWMKTIHYPYTIRSHLVTIVPMAPFTPKSTYAKICVNNWQITQDMVMSNLIQPYSILLHCID